ncbi:E3 ubiquitin-protein ligase Bre1-like [Teleopsis dalmanni]|uniref:E3 ubiquitin-protein ligase Bre1-like n=1 Tax=Teleopsis dalmanni TaxID=139649 RepID=UPI0018CDEE44|nr:E3 ubiquitin-protein ligase Bre1-like [Teleopsis dalmanni]XP_037927646.1 E3 ubiquitin-protein ligase Bre1-like [Teleopsis dalmanni]XP_037927647.1 E3 ubiquitin-protein ligase Bre1-like [Teleopsis dalmanni]
MSVNLNSGTTSNLNQNMDKINDDDVSAFSVQVRGKEALRFQNKKLTQRLNQLITNKIELDQRIQKLEEKQKKTEEILNIFNSHWNQLNEDVHILLQHFNAESRRDTGESERSGVFFLNELYSLEKKELNIELANKVQLSKEAVTKIVSVVNYVMERSDKVADVLKDIIASSGNDAITSSESVDGTIKYLHVKLMTEYIGLQKMNMNLITKNHKKSLELKLCQQRLNNSRINSNELNKQIEEVRYDFGKMINKNLKLENYLAEFFEKIKSFRLVKNSNKNPSALATKMMANISREKYEELQDEMRDCRELADNRHVELDKLHSTHLKTLKEVEQLKMYLNHLPESAIVETPEYKCLQSKFSVLVRDSLQMRSSFEEINRQLTLSTNVHSLQIEEMERQEQAAHQKLEDEMKQKADLIKEYQMKCNRLRAKMKEDKILTELTTPINREMQSLIKSILSHNEVLKSEVELYKSKYNSCADENVKMLEELLDTSNKLQLYNMQETLSDDGSKQKAICVRTKDPPAYDCKRASQHNIGSFCETFGDPPTGLIEEMDCNDEVKSFIASQCDIRVEQSVTSSSSSLSPDNQLEGAIVSVGRFADMESKECHEESQDSLEIGTIQTQAGEIRQHDPPIVIHQLRIEKAQLEQQLKEQLKNQDKEKYILQKDMLERKLITAREEKLLLEEIEVTGEAFDDLQQKNWGLLRHLCNTNAAMLKSLSERNKNNRLLNLLREEVMVRGNLLAARDSEINGMGVVLGKLQEKTIVLKAAIDSQKKEMVTKQAATDEYKKKAVECERSAAHLRLCLEKYHNKLIEAQNIIFEKTDTIEVESFKRKRVNEECEMYQRNAGRMEKPQAEAYGEAKAETEAGDNATKSTVDEILLEEHRDCKKALTCSICEIRMIDAILVKCYHVFCYACLSTRYKMQQRKCPKCHKTFGVRDFHQLYLT